MPTMEIKNTIIKGCYSVTDCEHNGDIQSAVNHLKRLGCNVTGTYWDGHDCGEAYVNFTIASDKFVSVYNQICSSASFDTDINEYLPKAEQFGNWQQFDHKQLIEINNTMSENTKGEFWNEMPLLLFFNDKGTIKPKDIIKKCLSYLKHPYKVIGYDKHVTDGNIYYDVLISSSYKNLTREIMTDGIGDYAIGNDGFIKKNHIYGECSCTHKYINYAKMYGYEYLQRVIKLIMDGKPLMYRNQDQYYFPIDIELTRDEYMDGNNFKPTIERNGKKYTIKDPRAWTKRDNNNK